MTRERKPALTHRVIRGLLSATSFVLAGESDGFSAKEWKELEDSDQWLRRMREYKIARAAETPKGKNQ